MNRLLILLLLSPLFSSCSDDLDEKSFNNKNESINGFNIEWRNQITAEQKDIIREILNNMIFVEGGSFVMGATPEQGELARKNEYPNIYIKLSNYYINRYEVNDNHFNVITGLKKTSSDKYASRITLNDWKLFLSILSDLTSINFAFPTEAQWEYAARGGKKTKNFRYPGSNELSDVHTNSHLNGSQVPNELGLFNMADLKSEWCEDMYKEYEAVGLEINRLNKTGEYHVVRGGNFLCNKESDLYYPTGSNTSYSSTMYFRLGNSQKLFDRELDYRHCRITSRSYEYDNEVGTDYIGCRLVVNLNSIQ